ncbi:hypothetical protein RRG08_031960 [Elysia crispata]|uniref:Secreted protein n=1 Tax=Elysia crispata TaxID=231223 RepID=A0AAE0Z404_9GAST|nr:hypothetical protein RRG08_031960 [Elysia crispata]
MHTNSARPTILIFCWFIQNVLPARRSPCAPCSFLSPAQRAEVYIRRPGLRSTGEAVGKKWPFKEGGKEVCSDLNSMVTLVKTEERFVSFRNARKELSLPRSYGVPMPRYVAKTRLVYK